MAQLPPQEKQALLKKLSPKEKLLLEYAWRFWARPNQLAPEGDWETGLWLAGRGFGKTRTGAEWVREQVEQKGKRRLALIAPTAADVRDVMVEGESGLLAICPPWFRPIYEPSKRRIVWPNGAIAHTYSADEPERLRGPQHDGGWLDELCAWRYSRECWDMFQFGLRLGDKPQCVITTTPKPTPLLREIVKDPTTAVTKGNTYDNLANLAPSFIKRVINKYEGTRLGRQEIHAEILDDNPNALLKRAVFDAHRLKQAPPDLDRIVVAIDPAVSNDPETSDEVGIIVAGRFRRGDDHHACILEDASGIYSPLEWATRAIELFHLYKADRIVGEVNQGGNLVEYTLRSVDSRIPFTALHASRGKRTRAEPVAALYERGLVHHIGEFGTLEDQWCNWNPSGDEDSPDRLDADVWALTELLLESGGCGIY